MLDWDAVAAVPHSPHSLQSNARAVSRNANMNGNAEQQSDEDENDIETENSNSGSGGRSVDMSWALLNPMRTLAILVRTRSLRLLTLACALNSIAGNGADVVETSFANSQFNFTPAQLATLNIVGGVATIGIQARRGRASLTAVFKKYNFQQKSILSHVCYFRVNTCAKNRIFVYIFSRASRVFLSEFVPTYSHTLSHDLKKILSVWNGVLIITRARTQVGIAPLLLRWIASPLRVAQLAALIAAGAAMLQAVSWNALSFDAGSGARSFGSLVLPIRTLLLLFLQKE